MKEFTTDINTGLNGGVRKIREQADEHSLECRFQLKAAGVEEEDGMEVVLELVGETAGKRFVGKGVSRGEAEREAALLAINFLERFDQGEDDLDEAAQTVVEKEAEQTDDNESEKEEMEDVDSLENEAKGVEEEEKLENGEIMEEVSEEDMDEAGLRSCPLCSLSFDSLVELETHASSCMAEGKKEEEENGRRVVKQESGRRVVEVDGEMRGG